MTTVGDRILNISLPKIGEKSLFTKDLEDALRSGIVDFVVHSLKDLPTALPDGMAIGAVLEREDARDALVLAKHNDGKTFQTLPEGSIIGKTLDGTPDGILWAAPLAQIRYTFFLIVVYRHVIVASNGSTGAIVSTLASARYSGQFEHSAGQTGRRRVEVCRHCSSTSWSRANELAQAHQLYDRAQRNSIRRWSR